MKTEIKEPGLVKIEKSEELRLTEGLIVHREERKNLIEEFNSIKNLDPSIKENSAKFKALRLKFVKNRTQGIDKWHSANKAAFLAGGRYVDSIKNKEHQINETYETPLMKGEKYFENLEKERKERLQLKRVEELRPYLESPEERDWSEMDDDIYTAFYNSTVKAFNEKIEAEKLAAEAEAKRLAEEKAEQDRIKKENELLKKQAEERERLAKIEAEKLAKEEKARKAKEDALNKAGEARREMLFEIGVSLDFETCKSMSEKSWSKFYEEKNNIYQAEENRRALELLKQDKEKKAREEAEAKKQALHDAQLKKEREAKEKIQREAEAKRIALENELKAKEESEKKAREEAEALKQLELSKGDAEKVQDLIMDLESLKFKYTFEASKNVQMYTDVKVLLDKVINHINKQ